MRSEDDLQINQPSLQTGCKWPLYSETLSSVNVSANITIMFLPPIEDQEGDRSVVGEEEAKRKHFILF